MPKVYYAHRGLYDNISDAPENSLAAFQKAVDAGYGIELDVQMTADGKVVVVHDFNLKRISGVDKEIDQCTYEELQEYPIYGSDQRVPLFEDVLKAVDGKVPLIVELKYKEGSKICEKAQEILNSYTGIYCIESFHPQVLVWYRKNYPHICRGQLSMNFEKDKAGLPWYKRFIAGNLLPLRAVSALSVALYGMFLAIIIPPARKDKVVAGLVVLSFALSFVCTYLPGISALSDGTRTIILTVAISCAGALLFPVKTQSEEAEQ